MKVHLAYQQAGIGLQGGWAINKLYLNKLGSKNDYLSGENYKDDQQPEHQIPRNDLHAASQPTKNGVHLFFF